jgi:hypothetical protein
MRDQKAAGIAAAALVVITQSLPLSQYFQ